MSDPTATLPMPPRVPGPRCHRPAEPIAVPELIWRPDDLDRLTAEGPNYVETVAGPWVLARAGAGPCAVYSVGIVKGLSPHQACMLLIQVGAQSPR